MQGGHFNLGSKTTENNMVAWIYFSSTNIIKKLPVNTEREFLKPVLGYYYMYHLKI